MTVEDLIEELKTMPPTANVEIVFMDDIRQDIDLITYDRGVVTIDCGTEPEETEDNG